MKKISIQVILPIVCLLISAGTPYWLMPSFGQGAARLISWAIDAGLVIRLCLSIPPSSGTMKPLYVLISDETNTPEVSRLLTFAWFVILMSAYLSCALWNVALSSAGTELLPLVIKIPPNVWLLAGIILGPALATSIVTSSKIRSGELKSSHVLTSSAPLSRMFTYQGLPDVTDFSPIYHFLIQITLWVAYIVALGHLIYTSTTAIDEFPDIPSGLLVIATGTAGVYVADRSISRK